MFVDIVKILFINFSIDYFKNNNYTYKYTGLFCFFLKNIQVFLFYLQIK